MSINPSRIASVEDARKFAARSVPRALFDYVDGGADDEITMTENITAFRRIGLIPRMGVRITEPNLSIELFGRTLTLPVILAPCGLVNVMHPDGPKGVAQAAASRGVASVLSAVAGISPEAMANAVDTSSTPMWFQLYSPKGRSDWEGLVDRVATSGYTALVVTLDTPVLGNRERDGRNGILVGSQVGIRSAATLALQVAGRPTWAARMATATLAARRSPRPSGPTVGLVAAGGSPFTWKDIREIRDRWTGPLLVKGVLSVADARSAIDSGCNGVIVSNHGGRQLDGAPATMSVLPEIAEAVGSATTVLVDGGVRRGSDVVKALAAGANAVLIGRPYLYGLEAAGAAGVARILDIFRRDIERTLVLLGCPTVANLDRQWIDLKN